jgi:uncharacterized membrane protein YfcA
LAAAVFFLLAALICEIMGTIGGFGSSVFFVPVAQFFYPFQVVLGLTGLLHVFSNISKLYLFRQHVNYKLLFYYGIPSVGFVVLGAYLNTFVELKWAQLTLGIFLVCFSLFMLWFPSFVLPASKTNAVVSGASAGFIAGFNGTGGAIRGMSMAAFGLSKNVFVATSAAIDFGVDLSRSAIYLDHGYLKKEHLYLIPGLIIISFVGSWMGKRMLNKIDEVWFKKIVLTLILVIGVLIIYKETLSFYS